MYSDLELQTITHIRQYFLQLFSNDRSMFPFNGEETFTLKSCMEGCFVKSQTFYDSSYPAVSAEWLHLVRKDGLPFTKAFLINLRPLLKELVNEIIQANNDFIVDSNYFVSFLTDKSVKNFLDFYVDSDLPLNWGEFASCVDCEGAIVFRGISGTTCGKWNYTQKCESHYIEFLSLRDKGNCKLVKLFN